MVSRLSGTAKRKVLQITCSSLTVVFFVLSLLAPAVHDAHSRLHLKSSRVLSSIPYDVLNPAVSQVTGSGSHTWTRRVHGCSQEEPKLGHLWKSLEDAVAEEIHEPVLTSLTSKPLPCTTSGPGPAVQCNPKDVLS